MSQKTKTPSNRRRRVRILLASLGLALVAAVAFAAVLGGANLRGKVEKGEFALGWAGGIDPGRTQVYEVGEDGSLGAKVGTARDVTLSSPVNGSTNAYRDLTIASGQTVYDGEAIVLERAGVRLSGDTGRAGYVSGLQAVGVPEGWTITLTQGCGASLTLGSAPQPVTIRMEPTPEAGDLDLTALNVQVMATAGTKPADLVCTPIGG